MSVGGFLISANYIANLLTPDLLKKLLVVLEELAKNASASYLLPLLLANPQATIAVLWTENKRFHKATSP